MVGREPELLTAPIQDMQQRLLHMRIASPGTDIIDLVQREPSLLVEGPLAWGEVRRTWNDGTLLAMRDMDIVVSCLHVVVSNKSNYAGAGR